VNKVTIPNSVTVFSTVIIKKLINNFENLELPDV